MTQQVFINYRRKLNVAEARLLKERLERELPGVRIFLDVSGKELEDSDHWPSTLATQVDASGALVSLIGAEWLDVKAPNGSRRLDDANDFVRFEIARAVGQGIPVLPVRVDSARMPEMTEFPTDIAQMSFTQAVLLRNESFEDDAKKIAARLKAIMAKRRPRGVSAWFAGVSAAAMLVVGGGAGWLARPIPPSEQELQSQLAEALRDRNQFRQAVVASDADLRKIRDTVAMAESGKQAAERERHAALEKIAVAEGLAALADKSKREALAALAAAEGFAATLTKERNEAWGKLATAEAAIKAAEANKREAEQRVASLTKERAEGQEQLVVAKEALSLAQQQLTAGTKDRASPVAAAQPSLAPVVKPNTESTSPVDKTKPLRTFTGHAEEIWAVAVAPDGKVAISGGGRLMHAKDFVLRLWDVPSGRLVRSLTGHKDRVLSVAFAPDGRSAISGGWDRTVKLWNIATGRELRTLKGHENAIESVAFSADGRKALSVSHRTMKLWDIETGRELRTFSGHEYSIKSVAFSPDGRTVISASDDKTLKLWDVGSVSGPSTATGRELRTFTGHTGGVVSVAFAPDGSTAISGSNDNTLKLWDVATGRELRTFTEHERSVASVAFAPDGRTVISGDYFSTLKLWDVATGRELRTFTGHTDTVTSVTFLPDGRTAISASADKTLKLWDVTP